MAEEENKADALSFEDEDTGNFAHLMGGGEVYDEKPKMDLGKAAPPKTQSDAGPRLQKQYTNLYEGEAGAFDDLFERVDDDREDEKAQEDNAQNAAAIQLKRTLDEAEPLINQLAESGRPK